MQEALVNNVDIYIYLYLSSVFKLILSWRKN